MTFDPNIPETLVGKIIKLPEEFLGSKHFVVTRYLKESDEFQLFHFDLYSNATFGAGRYIIATSMLQSTPDYSIVKEWTVQ